MVIPAKKVLLMIRQEVRFFQRHSRLFLGFVSLMNEWPEAIREGTNSNLSGKDFSTVIILHASVQHDLGVIKKK